MEVAGRQYREAMESRMERELPAAARAAFTQQVQQQPGRVTLDIDRGCDRGGFER